MLTSIIAETLNKIIALVADRLNAKIPPKRKGNQADLLKLHRSLSLLVGIIEEMSLLLGLGGQVEPGSPVPGPRWLRANPRRDVDGVVKDANRALQDVSLALQTLSPNLEIFAPEVKAIVDDFEQGDSAAIVRLESGVAIEDLTALAKLATSAKNAVAEFIRATYAFKDMDA